MQFCRRVSLQACPCLLLPDEAGHAYCQAIVSGSDLEPEARDESTALHGLWSSIPGKILPRSCFLNTLGCQTVHCCTRSWCCLHPIYNHVTKATS